MAGAMSSDSMIHVIAHIADDVIVGIEIDLFGIDTATSSRLVSELVQAPQLAEPLAVRRAQS